MCVSLQGLASAYVTVSYKSKSLNTVPWNPAGKRATRLLKTPRSNKILDSNTFRLQHKKLGQEKNTYRQLQK